MPLNLSELGLNRIRLISNLYWGVFLYRPGPVINACMLEKRYNCNPNSTKRSKLDRVDPVDNRPSTDKNGGPKQWCTAL